LHHGKRRDWDGRIPRRAGTRRVQGVSRSGAGARRGRDDGRARTSAGRNCTSGGEPPEVKEGSLGHEALCRVDSLGEGVETDYAGEPIEEGDLIAPVYYLTCRRCSACQSGQFHLCENVYEYWSRSPEEPPHFHGTFGTHYVVHRDQYFYKIPDGLDPGIAAGANCALAGDVRARRDRSRVRRQRRRPGRRRPGLNAIAYANERGAKTILVEGVDGRIDRGREFGVDHVVDFREYDTVEARAERASATTDLASADVGVEVAGVPEAFSGDPPPARRRALPRDGERHARFDGGLRPGTPHPEVHRRHRSRALRPVVSPARARVPR